MNSVRELAKMTTEMELPKQSAKDEGSGTRSEVGTVTEVERKTFRLRKIPL